MNNVRFFFFIFFSIMIFISKLRVVSRDCFEKRISVYYNIMRLTAPNLKIAKKRNQNRLRY